MGLLFYVLVLNILTIKLNIFLQRIKGNNIIYPITNKTVIIINHISIDIPNNK